MQLNLLTRESLTLKIPLANLVVAVLNVELVTGSNAVIYSGKKECRNAYVCQTLNATTVTPPTYFTNTNTEASEFTDRELDGEEDDGG
jgi:hypothetical protein